jgi:hypothetical protein
MTEFAPTLIDNRGNAFHGKDNDAHVQFYDKPEISQAETDSAGRPIYKDVLFVKVEFPGNNTTKLDQPATEDHKGRWPIAYRRYTEGRGNQVEGWLLKEWPVISRSDAENMARFGIYTVEQLASIADGQLDGLWLGSRTLRDKAINALAAANDGALVSKLTAENNSLRADLDALKRQVAQISAIPQTAPQIDIKALVAEALAEQLGAPKKKAA